MPAQGDASGVRLAELLAALSLATDLGTGFPQEKALRNLLIALSVADELDLDERTRADLYYASLIRFIGCTAFTYESSRLVGDEFAMIRTFAHVDQSKPKEMLGAIAATGRGHGLRAGARAIVKNAVRGKSLDELVVRADCEASARFADRFRLGGDVVAILTEAYERWDGKGARKLQGDEISIGARAGVLAHQVEIFHRTHGRAAALEMARSRAGGWFDPTCVTAFERCAGRVLQDIDAGSVWDAVLAIEPEPQVRITAERLDDLAESLADFVDLKSPYLLGHSREVARLAASGATSIGLPQTEIAELRRAALLHDLGRVSVPNAVWDKEGRLNASEWEQVRLHPYHAERILGRSSAFSPVASLVGAHHERLDGSGYHRGSGAALLTKAARLLAAADVFQALTSERPYRPAMPPDLAAKEMDAEVAVGRLDADAVAAVCAAGGLERPPPKAARPAGLTDREVDVLRLLARGLTKKQIAKALFIAPGTVHTHTVHIYEKCGVTTRAGVALFALEHGLLS